MATKKSVGLCYALVSRGKTVLCDHRRSDEGNFESTCQSVLDRILESSETKFSYDVEDHRYDAYVGENLIYICVSKKVFDRNMSFNCLFELERKLIQAGLKEKAKSAKPYGLRGSFSEVMASVLVQYSSSDVLGKLESRVDEVTNIMRDNIDKVVHRGEALDDIYDRSEQLAINSTDFRQSSTKLRRKLLWRNIKLWVILILIILVIISIIVVICVLASRGVFKKNK